MEEDIEILENLERDIFKASECSLTSSSEKKQWIKEAQAIRNIINKNKELRNHLDMAVNEINVLRKEIKELEKMVELMAFSLADYVMYYEYDKCRNPEMIKAKANEEINYFKKKASDENAKNKR